MQGVPENATFSISPSSSETKRAMTVLRHLSFHKKVAQVRENSKALTLIITEISNNCNQNGTPCTSVAKYFSTRAEKQFHLICANLTTNCNKNYCNSSVFVGKIAYTTR